MPLEGRLLLVLRSAGWDSRDAPVFIQSFEQSNLKELNKLTKIRLIQLVDANDVNPARGVSPRRDVAGWRRAREG